MGAGLATTAEDKKQDSASESANTESPQWAQSRFAPSGRGAWGDPSDYSSKSGGQTSGARSGMPLFLQPQVQMKCAECAHEEEEQHPPVQKKCAHCEAEEQRQREQGGTTVQAKCAACEAEGLKEKSSNGSALDGVENANRPLPHADRIQASFGRHDISGARAAVGGNAAQASGRMGALAYTSGDRVAFRSEPDVNLAAHEAAHVVQQRNGAKLPGGVGRPGDEYEQQADAAAKAVERGESAEPILDHGDSNDSGGDSAPSVQRRLDVNASRMYEPAIIGSDAMLGGAAGGGKAGAGTGSVAGKKGKPGAKGDEKEKEEAGDTKDTGGKKASAATPGALATGSGPASATQTAPQSSGQSTGGQAPAQDAQPATGSSTAAPGSGSSAPQNGASPQPAPAPNSSTEALSSAPDAGAAPAPAGKSGASCTPACYHEPSKDPDPEPDEAPPNPPAGQSQEQTKEGDEPDLPEPDNCATQQAQAGVPSDGQNATSSGGAQSAPAAASAATPAPAAAAGGSAAPTPAQPGAPKPATGSGKGAAAQVSGGGQAQAAQKTEPGPSPIEGSIMQSEAQRSAAVASYDASSKALDVSAANTTDLHSGVQFAASASGASDQAVQRDVAAARADQFFSNAADGLDQAISFALSDAPDQLGAQAEAGKAQIIAASETQKEAVSTRIAAARGEARGDAAIARRAVIQQSDSFVEQVQTGSTGAIAALTAAHAATVGQVDALETSTLDQVNQIYANGRTQMEGLGVTIGDECTAIGEQFATTYQGFEHCTENGFWDGDLSERRAYAQAEAARKTAKGYHDSMVDKAKKRAREVVRNGRKNNRCQVITTASTVRQKLDETLAQLTATIESARDHAIEQATSTRAALLTAIDSSLRATLRQLDQQEHDQRQTIDDTCYLQQVVQEQMAHTAAASLQGLVSSGASTLHDSLFMLRAQFASSEAPDPKVLDETLTMVTRNVEAALGSMQKGLLAGTAGAVQQLDVSLGAGLAGLDALVASNDETTTAVSSGFASSMGEIAGQDNFAEQRAGFSQLLQQATTGGIDGFQKILGAMRDGCGKITGDSQKSLKQAAGDLEKNLRESKQGIECQITKEADQAASHEAPAWKMLIAILLIIVVIVIVIAVTILTAGAGLGLLGVMALGAVVGAVTSGLITMATNLWTNQKVTKGVVRAMVIGAVTGAAGGAIGMGVGAVVGKVAGAALSVAAKEIVTVVLSTAIIDVGTQFYEGGFSLKNFSIKQLGIDLAVALVMHKAMQGLHPSEPMVAAPEAGAPPIEPPVVEPGLTEPMPAETTPTEPKPSEPIPAEGTPSEPTPSEPTPAEPPATPEPTPAEPAPAEPKPGEAAPTEPGEQGAPSEPGAQKELAPPGEAPMSPQEKTVLDRTANKPSEQLTPDEVLTEREVASRTEGKPIEDPPFTTEKELPNGHEMEETPEGEECKRCSKKCVTFNGNGERTGFTDEEISEHFAQETESTPEIDEQEFKEHADEVRENRDAQLDEEPSQEPAPEPEEELAPQEKPKEKEMPRRPKEIPGKPKPKPPTGKKPGINDPDAAEWRYKEYVAKKAAAGENWKGPDEWYDLHFKPSYEGGRPGRSGGPEQVAAKAKLAADEEVQQVENVELGGRYPDGVKPNPAGGTDYFEVGKMNNNGLPESRERIKIDDEIPALGPKDTVTFVDKTDTARRVTYLPGDTITKKGPVK